MGWKALIPVSDERGMGGGVRSGESRHAVWGHLSGGSAVQILLIVKVTATEAMAS